jgi:hypothetical protein
MTQPTNNRWDNTRITIEQVKALWPGLVVSDTRDNGRMKKGTEKARITMPMGKSMQVTGSMTREQVKAL